MKIFILQKRLNFYNVLEEKWTKVEACSRSIKNFLL